MKINPTNRIVKDIIMNQETIAFGSDYDLLMMLGVREGESNRRKQSIGKFSIDETKFARHADIERVLVYHPLKYVGVEELWSYLLAERKLPWGIKATSLYLMYKESSGECPMTQADGKQASSCGNSRQGCWVCTYSNEDKMLVNLIDSGNDSMIPLLEFKKILAEIRYDIRYREPLRRVEYKHQQKRLDDVSKDNQWIWKEMVEDYEYHSFQRANDWQFSPGSITFEGRKKLLQKLLYVQEQTGYQLIDQEEVQAIVECWREEGYEVTFRDLQPADWQYEGAVVLRPDGSLNTKETTNRNPIFPIWEEFDQDKDQIITFLRERARVTGKSLYYFMSYCDYHEHFGMGKEDLVYNTVQFIVCEPNIRTQKQARDYLDEWLGFNHVQEEGMDWASFAQRLHDRAIAYIQEPGHDPEVLQQTNKTLIQLGHCPVYSVDNNGQYSFAI